MRRRKRRRKRRRRRTSKSTERGAVRCGAARRREREGRRGRPTDLAAQLVFFGHVKLHPSDGLIGAQLLLLATDSEQVFGLAVALQLDQPLLSLEQLLLQPQILPLQRVLVVASDASDGST
eukprot:SAG22_NODE_285_length_12974_cov_2.969087_10_plen_121_part_00